MSQDTHTRSKNFDRVKALVYEDTPESVIDMIASQLDRSEEASRRIKEEGLVVRDLKGSVIPHPAIQTEITASKTYIDMLKKFSGL